MSVHRMPEPDEEDDSTTTVNYKDIGQYTVSYTPASYNYTTSSEINDYIFEKPCKRITIWGKLLSWIKGRRQN